MNPEEVRHFISRGRLAEELKDFGNFPAPALGVTIRKRETCALIMPIGGHVKPLDRKNWQGYRVAELSIQEGVGVFIDKDKDLRRRGAPDNGKHLVARKE